MDQPEEILEKLERFNVQKNPEIPRELDEYVSFVARTGDSVFAWPLVKNLYREKLINVITEFYNEQPTKELPTYPNVDPFNYDTMKKTLIERLDSFIAAPFTIQRISELLADPRKQYSRIDKFMRAVEKNILVVSTVAPGRHRSEESENGDSLDSALNGEFSSDVHVDIDMDNDGSFSMSKEFNATTHRKEANHEIVSTNHELVTIKKSASKEEEASTSAIAVDIVSGEPPQGTQTEISIESQSTVTITVCEPENKSNESVISTDASKEESTVEQPPSAASQEEALIKSEETLIPEIVDPKIEDALLNEPLRPADDEILVDTSGLRSNATTPLAALEEIVAIRTDPSLIEAVETPRSTSTTTPAEISQEEEDEDSLPEQKDTDDSEVCDEDSTPEAKRLKLEENEVKPEEVPPPTEKETDKVELAVVEEPLEKQPVDEKEVEKPIVEETTADNSEEPEQKLVESVKIEPVAPESESEVVEDLPIIETTPIATESIEETPIEEEVVNAASVQMDTVPIAETTNTMSLDEDEPPVVADMEIAPTAAAAANKMDTDENEAEAALMDVDDEPMDQ